MRADMFGLRNEVAMNRRPIGGWCPLWADAHGVVHAVIHPDEHNRTSDMTQCWSEVAWDAQQQGLVVTCLLCLHYLQVL